MTVKITTSIRTISSRFARLHGIFYSTFSQDCIYTVQLRSAFAV